MTEASAPRHDPYTRFRRVLLSPDEVRELSRLTPGRPVRDALLLWLQILAAWIVVATWTEWWIVLLAIPLIGTRHYALHVIGHDGVHRRLLADGRANDLLNDLLIYGPEGAITRLNGQNHLLHHQLLASDADPDRHKYSSANKTNVGELLAYLIGLEGLGPLWRNVFQGGSSPRAHRDGSERPDGRGPRRYTARDAAILIGWQIVIFSGLTWGIGWWAYPLLWLLPVYVFTYCGDLIRFFLEHAHPVPDSEADDRRLISYSSNWLERAFFSPMNINLHAAHHLWPSIPYYNLPRADALIRSRPGAEGLIWRTSYLRALLAYFRALPLPECRPSRG